MCDLNRDGLVTADELQRLLSSALRDTDIGVNLSDEVRMDCSVSCDVNECDIELNFFFLR